MKRSVEILLLWVMLFLLTTLHSTRMTAQVRDDRYVPKVDQAAFPSRGPVIMIDEAHNNYHTLEGLYKPFADFLRAHGCTVIAGKSRCTPELLATCDIYTIANALGESNIDNWSVPIEQAFSDEEVYELQHWIQAGGSLFLIVDHMPMPGAVENLARRFGIEFSNGFAMYAGKRTRGLQFVRANEGLRPHWITDTPVEGRRVDSIVTFTGSAFRIEGVHDALLVFGSHMVSLEPDVAWEFTDSTKRVNVEGWRQGAAMDYGSGRIVVFGEAAMFTAQLSSERGFPVGFNSPEGENNKNLLINIIRWLARRDRI